jgi:hypothetical protein
MRRIALAAAAVLVILVASAIMATRAIAMSITAPAGLTPAINETLPTEQAYWRRRHWRGWGWPRGFWGGWRRFWSGFPFFGPRWHGYRHYRHHRVHHRPRQKPAEEQKQQEEPQQK